jgi:SAM-dependent methyltransferase/predicted metal-dependent enzyme (double-stranded beta helix superfamily)
MQDILTRIASETPKDFDYEWLGQFVRSIDVDRLKLEGLIPPFEADSGNYARNILMMDPFEVVVLHWPPGVESAIHHHRGFWGYVLCVEGAVENVDYEYDEDAAELRECRALRVLAGGVLPEPDGTIHKIVNPSKDRPLVTVHFYAPALETLDGMVLFDAEKGGLAELNEKATTASFHQDESGFRRWVKDAFTFVPISSKLGHETHLLYPLIPKPDGQNIMNSLNAYYTEQAELYDALDGSSAKRSSYTAGINAIIAADMREHPPQRVMHIACGTGRRALDIRERSGMSYTVEGVDISASMVVQAKERGVEARIGIWNECDVSDGQYDAVAFLYAFGHIPTERERRLSLMKVGKALRPGGRFYFDVFNVENPNEWGPEAMRLFEELELDKEGYEAGDLFYKRHDGDCVAFLHYCTPAGIIALVAECGLQVVETHRVGYVERPGEALNGTNPEGNLLIVAERPV